MKKVNKIIFCLDRKFTNRDYQRFGCAYLEKLGYEVEVWNIDADRYEQVKIPQGYYQGCNVVDVSLREAKSKINRSAGAIFIILGNEFEKLLLCKRRRKYHVIKYVSAGSLGYGLPIIPKKLTNKFTGNFLKAMCTELKKYACRKTGCTADYYILNTHRCLFVPPGNVEKDRVQYVHTGDYDRYLEAKQRGISVSEELILYIDSGYGLVDIDSFREGYRDPWREKPEIHCKKRNEIFEKLEKHYELPVVIAGHPHTDYSNADFGGREIVFDQTCELTAKAKFVILQWSTAVSYTMLFEKPVMIMVDDEFIRCDLYHGWVYANYKLFDLKVCNMDRKECRDVPWEYVSTINDDKRKKYIQEFIKEEGTPEMLSYKALEQVIENLMIR